MPFDCVYPPARWAAPPPPLPHLERYIVDVALEVGGVDATKRQLARGVVLGEGREGRREGGREGGRGVSHPT